MKYKYYIYKEMIFDRDKDFVFRLNVDSDEWEYRHVQYSKWHIHPEYDPREYNEITERDAFMRLI